MDTLAAAHTVPPYASARPSPRALLLIVAAHAGVLALLASLQVVPLPTAMRTLTVDLLTPAAPRSEAVPPKAQPRPPEPKPVARRPAATKPLPQPIPQPLLAAPAEADAVAETPVVRAAPPTPSAAPPAASPTPHAPPAPTPISQPRFDADYLANPAPTYPPLSRRMGEEGKVVLRVHVDADGRPAQVELKTGSGSPRLDQAAQEAVRRWRFVPARRGDEALAAWVLVPIVFNLKN